MNYPHIKPSSQLISVSILAASINYPNTNCLLILNIFLCDIQQSCPLVLVPCSVLVLACVSIISPLHPLTKVANLLLSTLMRALVDGGYTECNVPALHDSVHSCHIHFILHIHWILAGKPHTICTLGGGILPLPGARIPRYPVHTLVSNIDYTLCVVSNTLTLT